MEYTEDACSFGVCVVVGGSGWTGSHLVGQLVRYRDLCTARNNSCNFKVHSIDIVPPSEEFKNLHAGEDSFILCDISNEAAVDELFSELQPKTVFHTASIVDLRQYPSPLLEQVNVNGTRNLIKSLNTHSSTKSDEATCFVYTSTFDVVSSKHGVTRATESAHYCSPPSNHYKRTKTTAEQLVRQNSCEGCLTCALRPGHIFGPGDALWKLVATCPVALGPPSARMSFTYVENLATAHIMAALALYKEKRCGGKGEGDGDVVNGSAFFVTDVDVNFHDFYKHLARMKTCSVRIPVWVLVCVVALVELGEMVCFFLLRTWFVRYQLMHAVTGVTSAVLESGGQVTVVSDRARRLMGYGDVDRGFVKHEEAVRCTVQWGQSQSTGDSRSTFFSF